ncbi:MAG: mandelate racemase/muconate lactonizing enzyme family protein [Dehalococcoidia bacterium]|jgi:L-alanine-DL-glutamate epimerase-like enolase superfamily enzyme|nr:mandelate racemase/muconate lactonizing enzyme family protein [Dehalococcoidia bacterium]
MKITNIRSTRLFDTASLPFQDSTMPSAVDGLAWMFVELETDAGITGVAYSEGAGPVRAFMHEQLGDLVIGADPFETEKIWNDMFWRVRGNGRKGAAFQAISTLDNAIWDIKAKALGIPLYRLLGPAHEQIPVYGSGGWTNYTTDQLVKEQSDYAEEGFTATKMKVGMSFGKAEAEDIRRVGAVRKVLGDDHTIYVDANNGYYAKQAIRVAEPLKDLGVAWFEEPVLADDIPGLAQVAGGTTIDVATGEHEYTKYGFRDLIAAGAADILQPDIGRVGGVTEWMKVAHLAAAHNLPVAPHAYSLLHLHPAMATPNIMVVEVLGIERDPFAKYLVDPPAPVNGSWKPDPDKPGNGIELNPHAVEKYRLD